jgi:hypothetical protein
MSEPRWNDTKRPSPAGGSPRWGQLPWGRGIVIIAAAAGLGALLTIIMGGDPGLLLGLLVVVGTVAASLAVKPRRAYLIIPAPALAYLAAAILAGLIHDRAADAASHTLLIINVGRWAASGFLGMIAATALAVVITIPRWLRASQGTGFRPTRPLRQAQRRDSRPTATPDRSSAQRELRRRG